MKSESSTQYWSPYLAGAAIGLTLLAAVVFLGSGLGASGAIARMVAAAFHAIAPQAAEAHPYFKTYFTEGRSPLQDWMIYQFAGVFLGGLIGALTAKRWRPEVEKGPGASRRQRLLLAFTGGTLTGVAARLARGCTSGQALTGGSMLSLGSWAFMLSVFAGGYLAAWFVRRQWS
jgi:uncharacterized membrane protein YedE/YeeE